MTDEKECRLLDPIAFTLALLAAPLLVGLLGFWALLIPVIAVPVGGPLYLAVGTPVLLWMLTRYPPEFEVYACAGLLTILALFVLAALLGRMLPEQDFGETFSYLLWGLPFAPLWSGTFALLYRRWYRPLSL